MTASRKEGAESFFAGIAVLLAGLMLVDVLPNMLKSLYTQYSETLVFSYGVFAFCFLGVILLFVGMSAIRELPVFFESLTFGWRTRESYLSGAGKKDKTKKAEK